MSRLLGLLAPLFAVAALIVLPAGTEACWRRARACPAPCPPVVYAPCPPVSFSPAEQLVSQKTGRVYAIIDTGEADPHEKDVRTPPVTAKGIDRFNSFTGKSRRVAKVSIANSPQEDFASVSELLAGPNRLKPDAEMKLLNIPHGSGSEDSDRVAAEKRNVRVRAFLYAFKKESDNDYHVIIGDPPGTPGARYFNVEISGLPTDEDDPTAEAKQKLRTARSDFKSFFQLGNTGPNSYKRPNPPVEVIVAGSAFWDAEHPPPSTVGPTAFKPKTAWEIHPITAIEFEP